MKRAGLIQRGRSLLWAGCLWSVAFALPAQTPASGTLQPTSEYVFRNWQLDDGLPQISVTCILQAKDGYLWLGTTGGLVRFDGVRFTVFDSGNTPELLSIRIRSLFETDSGELLIATESGGVTRYVNGRFERLPGGEGLGDYQINEILSGPEKSIWLATESGLIRYQNGQLRVFGEADGLKPSHISDAHIDPAGNIWLGTRLSLDIYREGRVAPFAESARLPSQDVSRIFQDSTGYFWFSTPLGVIRWRDGESRLFTMEDGLPSNLVRAMHEDRYGNLWFGTTRGIARFKDGRFVVEGEASGLPKTSVFCFYEDREGNIWIGTDSTGLYRAQPATVRTLLPNLDDVVRSTANTGSMIAVLEDREGALWFAPNCAGLYRYHNGELTKYNTVTHGLSNQCIWSLAEDGEGGIWMGTYGGGLWHLKDGVVTQSPGVQPDGVVLAIYQDPDKILWLGSISGGLRRVRGSEVKSWGVPEGMPSAGVHFILPARDGGLWLGTHGGLAHFKDGQIKAWTMADGLSNNNIRSIHEDASGDLWVGTYGGGLNHFSKGKFTIIEKGHGLFDNVVHRIFDDGRGNFWMSGNQGIFRTARRGLEEFIAGNATKIECVTYGVADGMLSRECNGGFQPAGWQSRNGSLWFPTQVGLAQVWPDREVNRRPPPVVVEQLIIDRKPRPAVPVMELEPGERNFEILYTGLSLTSSEKVRFQYRLDPLDADWQYVGERRAAYYTRIPPGKYTFHVLAANRDGVWNQEGASIDIVVPPYFYETRWFFGGMAITVLGVGMLGHRLRLRSIQRNQQRLEQTVAERTRELKELADQLVVTRDQALAAAEAKTQFVANLSHEIRTPMNAILGFAELMTRTAYDVRQRSYLDAISSSGRTLLALINDILDLSKIEAGKLELQPEPVSLRELLKELRQILLPGAEEKKLELVIEIAPTVPDYLRLDQTRLRQVLFNLMGNAIKFTEQGGVRVRVSGELDDSRRAFALRIAVTDTGIGIPEDEHERIFQAFTQTSNHDARKYGGTGLGLTITRRIVELMQGKVTLQSRPGEGSTFTVSLKQVPVTDPPASKATPAEAAVELRRFASVSILVVDDVAMNRSLIAGYFAGTPHALRFAASGPEAIALSLAESSQIILLDVQMPEMDGYAVTRKLRELLPADKQSWIVALTAEAMEGVREKCLAVGMNDYLSKPVRGQDLADALNRYVMAQNVKTSLAEFPRMNTEILNELQELKHSAGNSLFDEMVELFLTETPRRFKELRAAIDASDHEAAQRAAHAQKGASANLGAEGMADLCRELEKTAGDTAEALRLFALLEQEFVRVEKYFRSSLHATTPVVAG